MSNTAAQDHDPESLHTVLIDTGKPPRHRWKQAIFALRAQPVLFNSISNPTDNHGQKRSPTPSRVSSSSSYNALNTHDAEEIAEIPPDVSLQIVSDGSENRNCNSDQQLLLDTIARMVKKKDLESLNAFGGAVRHRRAHVKP
ncbi:hypothetical protein L1049_016271 [Liquidambar formosana]|uniref:Uncharacterized protein n=1 Tax=Liquidambar formosana TaxID=63359 RepID=A0AAP0X0E1_LIQFO